MEGCTGRHMLTITYRNRAKVLFLGGVNAKWKRSVGSHLTMLPGHHGKNDTHRNRAKSAFLWGYNRKMEKWKMEVEGKCSLQHILKFLTTPPP